MYRGAGYILNPEVFTFHRARMYVDGEQLCSANGGRFGYQLAQRNRREQNVVSMCLAGQRQRGTNWTKRGQKSILQQLPRAQGAHHNVPQGCLHQPLLCQQPSQTSCMHCEDLERTFAPHIEFSPSACDQAPYLCLPPRTTRLTPCLLSLKQPASTAQCPCHSSSTSEPARWV